MGSGFAQVFEVPVAAWSTEDPQCFTAPNRDPTCHIIATSPTLFSSMEKPVERQLGMVYLYPRIIPTATATNIHYHSLSIAGGTELTVWGFALLEMNWT